VTDPDFGLLPEIHDLPFVDGERNEKASGRIAEAFERQRNRRLYAGPQSEGLKRFDPPLKSGAIVPSVQTSFIVPPFW
jgi:hypothetical protein